MTTFRTIVPAFAAALMSFGVATPSEAFWGGNYKKGSALEARRACQTWSRSQGQLTIRPVVAGTGYPRNIPNNRVFEDRERGTVKVPVAYCLEEPESRTVIGLEFQVANRYINNSSNELEGVGLPKVVRRFRY